MRLRGGSDRTVCNAEQNHRVGEHDRGTLYGREGLAMRILLSLRGRWGGDEVGVGILGTGGLDFSGLVQKKEGRRNWVGGGGKNFEGCSSKRWGGKGLRVRGESGNMASFSNLDSGEKTCGRDKFL